MSSTVRRIGRTASVRATDEPSATAISAARSTPIRALLLVLAHLDVDGDAVKRWIQLRADRRHARS